MDTYSVAFKVIKHVIDNEFNSPAFNVMQDNADISKKFEFILVIIYLPLLINWI